MLLPVILTLCFAVILYQLYFVLVKPLLLKRTLISRFPSIKHHWFWGNMNDLKHIDQVLPVFKQWLKTYQTCCLIFVGPFRVALRIVHPDFAKAITNSSEPKSFIYDFVKPWLGESILITDGPIWKRNRRLLTPAFHFDNLRQYVGEFSKSANDLFSQWTPSPDGSIKVDCFEQMSWLTLDSFMKCAFGQKGFLSETNDLDQSKHPYVELVNRAATLFTDRARSPWLSWDWLYYSTPMGWEYRRVYTAMHRYSELVIRQRRKQLEAGEIDKNSKKLCFIDIVLMAKDSNGNGLTDKEIRMEVDTFMFAGHDTTTSALSWCFYNLAVHPDHQQLCRLNVLDVLGDRQTVEWSDLSKLDYLTNTIKESLRLYPTVPGVSRSVTKELPLPDGTTIPAGTFVGIGIDCIHRHPDFWQRPDEFDPNRFQPENSVGRHSHAFLPFSAGPRNCIGQHFALAEIKTVVALALQRYRIEVDGTWPEPKVYQSIVLRSINGVHLKFYPL